MPEPPLRPRWAAGRPELDVRIDPDPIPSNRPALGGELPNKDLLFCVPDGLKLGFEVPNKPLMFMDGGGPAGVDEGPKDLPG